MIYEKPPASYRETCKLCGEPVDIPSWRYCDRLDCRTERTRGYASKSFFKKLRETNKKTN